MIAGAYVCMCVGMVLLVVGYTASRTEFYYVAGGFGIAGMIIGGINLVQVYT